MTQEELDAKIKTVNDINKELSDNLRPKVPTILQLMGFTKQTAEKFNGDIWVDFDLEYRDGAVGQIGYPDDSYSISIDYCTQTLESLEKQLEEKRVKDRLAKEERDSKEKLRIKKMKAHRKKQKEIFDKMSQEDQYYFKSIIL